LRAYSKKRFDPFCRWDRISIPYKDNARIQTTIGQLNFFKWALENNVIHFIEENHTLIEHDMNNRNSTSKNKESFTKNTNNKTRKKREELSVSAVKSIKREEVEIIVKFD
jgi:phage antirepressor YoqD-like protein